MSKLIITLILLITIIIIVVVSYFIVKSKVGDFTQKYFGTRDLKEAIEKSEVEASNTPKSLSSMDSIYLNKINEDFPSLNINEIKSMATNAILDCFHMIEKGECSKNVNERIKSLVQSKIDDNKNKKVSYNNIHFHNSVVNRYQKKDNIASIYIQCSLEYFYKVDNDIGKKIQDRYLVEVIRVIDIDKVDEEYKALGLNCPNCGAPLKNINSKRCDYCDTPVEDLIQRTWTVNNIKQD